MKRFFLILPMLFALLNAIVCIDADGAPIPQDRQFHFSYHNSSNDYNLYGANKWAVKFNFRNAYPGMSQLSFDVHGARLWFPNTGGEVTAELYNDFASQPGSMISSSTSSVVNNQVDILFDEISNHETVWLVVSYVTNMHNRFVAASAGGGSNSYYMNQIGDQSYLASLAVSGFNCELLFGVLGDFVLPEQDLELSSFSLQGDLLPGTRAYPTFSVYNHSDFTVNSASLRILMNRPGFPAYDTREISLDHPIQPRSEFFFDAEDYFIDLPDISTQLRLDLLLQSEFTENDTLLANNSQSITYNIFSEAMPVRVVENFLREHEAAPIMAMQNPYLDESTHVFDFFPVLSDPDANLGSIRRFNWYGFNSIPRTVGNGNRRITGLSPAYESSFEELVQDISEDRSFITSSSCRLDSIPDSENVSLTISLSNQNTTMYTGIGQSLMSNSRFFVGLFAKAMTEESPRYTLQRWIVFADTLNNPLNMGSTMEKRYTISASGLFDESLQLRYRIYYWVQGSGGGRIHYASYQSFEPGTHTSNSDAHVPALDFRIYPNPLRSNDKLHISLEKRADTDIYIYNLKGQIIHRESGYLREARLDSDLFPGSGIYFVRIVQAGTRQQTKRVSIIK